MTRLRSILRAFFALWIPSGVFHCSFVTPVHILLLILNRASDNIFSVKLFKKKKKSFNKILNKNEYENDLIKMTSIPIGFHPQYWTTKDLLTKLSWCVSLLPTLQNTESQNL